MVLALLAALGAAIFLLTIVNTANSYPRLPERIPMHFGIDGTVDGYGPRFSAWLMVALQLVSGAVFAWVLGLYIRQGVPARAVFAMAAFADFIIVLFWRAQQLIIATALSGKKRVDLTSFWMFFGATMTCAVALVLIFAR